MIAGAVGTVAQVSDSVRIKLGVALRWATATQFNNEASLIFVAIPFSKIELALFCKFWWLTLPTLGCDSFFWLIDRQTIRKVYIHVHH